MLKENPIRQPSPQKHVVSDNLATPFSPLATQLESSLSIPFYSNPRYHSYADSLDCMQRNSSTNPISRVQEDLSRTSNHNANPSQTQDLWHDSGSISRLNRGAQGNLHLGRSTQLAGHKRNSSGSTVASTGPSSPFTPVSALYPHIVDADPYNYTSSSENFEPVPAYNSIPKVSVASIDNPTFGDPYLAADHRNPSGYFNDADAQVYFQLAMRDHMAQQAAGAGSGEGLRKTSSSDFADDYKASMDSRNGVPKLDRTMSDIYQDELYNPNVSIGVLAPTMTNRTPAPNESHLSPRRDVFSERLQAANHGHISARSGSPATTLSRERSPFRPTSEYARDEIPTNHRGTPAPRLGSAAQLRERQKAESDAQAFARHHQKNSIQPTRTISPKEALLDMRDRDEEQMSPLFAPDESDPTERNGSEYPEAVQDHGNTDSLSGASTAQQSDRSPRRTAQPQLPQQYPFISQPRRQNSSLQSNSDAAPEFPAHLTSMESTRSDSKSSHSQSDTSEIQRPASTTADSGTYSCTYHGCAMRFETPAKLQRHKRDGHRQGTPPSATSSDAMAGRNTQAGPHKCERINPSTGKPCNSIFSRPYDLTRHEDTIHNARKQKVKCQFCTEEKTFSRNDALTRHMRVVHPEVDFPGKTKRKG